MASGMFPASSPLRGVAARGVATHRCEYLMRVLPGRAVTAAATRDKCIATATMRTARLAPVKGRHLCNVHTVPLLGATCLAAIGGAASGARTSHEQCTGPAG